MEAQVPHARQRLGSTSGGCSRPGRSGSVSPPGKQRAAWGQDEAQLAHWACRCRDRRHSSGLMVTGPRPNFSTSKVQSTAMAPSPKVFFHPQPWLSRSVTCKVTWSPSWVGPPLPSSPVLISTPAGQLPARAAGFYRCRGRNSSAICSRGIW